MKFKDARQEILRIGLGSMEDLDGGQLYDELKPRVRLAVGEMLDIFINTAPEYELEPMHLADTAQQIASLAGSIMGMLIKTLPDAAKEEIASRAVEQIHRAIAKRNSISSTVREIPITHKPDKQDLN